MGKDQQQNHGWMTQEECDAYIEDKLKQKKKAKRKTLIYILIGVIIAGCLIFFGFRYFMPQSSGSKGTSSVTTTTDTSTSDSETSNNSSNSSSSKNSSSPATSNTSATSVAGITENQKYISISNNETTMTADAIAKQMKSDNIPDGRLGDDGTEQDSISSIKLFRSDADYSPIGLIAVYTNEADAKDNFDNFNFPFSEHYAYQFGNVILTLNKEMNSNAQAIELTDEFIKITGLKLNQSYIGK